MLTDKPALPEQPLRNNKFYARKKRIGLIVGIISAIIIILGLGIGLYFIFSKKGDNDFEVINTTFVYYGDETATEIIVPEKFNNKNVVAINFDSLPITMQSITLPKTLNTLDAGSFADFTNLTEIIVDENNETFSSSSGLLFNKALTSLLAVPPNIEDFPSIPLSVILIEKYAFKNIKLTTLDLSNTRIQRISSYAFANSECQHLLFPLKLRIIDINGLSLIPNLIDINLLATLNESYTLPINEYLPSTAVWKTTVQNSGYVGTHTIETATLYTASFYWVELS